MIHKSHSQNWNELKRVGFITGKEKTIALQKKTLGSRPNRNHNRIKPNRRVLENVGTLSKLRYVKDAGRLRSGESTVSILEKEQA